MLANKVNGTEEAIGPLVMISSIFLLRKTTSDKLYSGKTPNITSIFASPKSASNISTRYPNFLNCTAKFTAVLDFPTPPFPLVISKENVRFLASKLMQLDTMFDIIIVDTGAGISDTVMEFVKCSKEHLFRW